MGLFDFNSLKKAVATLGDGLADVRANIYTLRGEREQVANAPPAKSDLVKAYSEWVHSARATYENGLVRSLEPLLRKPGVLLERERAQKHMSVVCASVKPENELTAGNLDAALCFLLHDQIVAAIEEAINKMPFEGGLPMAERAKKLQQLDEQIARLEAEESAFLDTAREAGVLIE